MAELTVECRDLKKSLAGVTVVDQLTFTVAHGTILALLGPSGCGKTTTLRLLAGFEKPDDGQIKIAGRVVSEGRFNLPPEDRRVGMVFQDYAIFPHLTVAQNVAFGLKRGQAARERTAEMLDLVGLKGTDEQMPHELSGGQQQRVALARALAPEPAVLLLDEPFSNLDTSLRTQVRREVRDLLKFSQATAIFVTHDQEEALYIGDQVAVMNQGKLEQIGTPEKVFHRPQTRFVADFVGQTDFLSGSVTDQGVETMLGFLQQRLPLVEDSVVEVALRPDDIQVTSAAAGGNGHIVERQFVGIAIIYTIVLADGTHVHSWQPHTLNLAPGMAVDVGFRPGHSLSCFSQGELVLEIPDSSLQ